MPTHTDGTPTICYRDYEYGKRVMSGEQIDPTWGCRIYETHLAKGESYKDPAVWPRANPAPAPVTTRNRSPASRVTVTSATMLPEPGLRPRSVG